MTVHKYGDPSIPRVAVDLDGVVASGGAEVYSDAAGWAYEKCTVISQGAALLHALRSAGICIILHSSRWEEDRAKTVAWLEEHGLPYDDLVLRKPFAHAYIDDRNLPYPFIPEVDGTDSNIQRIVAHVLRCAEEEP